MNDEDTKVIRDEEEEMNENSELNQNVDTQEESMESDLGVVSDDDIPSNWIMVSGGKFVCSECENESAPETNTVDGTVEADTEKIKLDLQEAPTKIVYGSCPICGMEYLFKERNGDLYMEPSDMLK